MSRRRRSKVIIRKLAEERIDILLKQAMMIAPNRPDLARKWIKLARRVARKARIKFPQTMSKRVCKRCGSVYTQGRTSRVRVRKNRSTHVSITCLECGAIRRFFVRKQA